MVRDGILQCYALAVLVFLFRRFPEFVTGIGFGFLYLVIVGIIYDYLREQ